MNLVFSGSNSTEIEFKVGIAGTATTPQRVMAVLEQDGISLSFVAREEGGAWRAVVSNLGQVFKEGVANFSINVILNDKLFIPMKNAVTIQTESPVSVEMTPSVVPTANVEPELPEVAVQIATAEEVEQVAEPIETIAPVKVEPVIEPVVQKPAPIKQEEAPKPPVVAQKFSLLRSIEPVKKPVQEATKIVQPRKVVESAPRVTSFRLKRTKVVTE